MNAHAHIYSVSELTRTIRGMLENTFPAVWVEGEISNFVLHTSGHMYFSLKDPSSVLQAVLFKNVNKNLPFAMKSGIKVTCFGRISLYDKRGQYQLIVERIEPKGVGALQLAFEQLKEKLRTEGLFDRSRKQSIPYLPRAIGVITSPTGAAIRDVLNVARRRFANVEIILNPVKVQGPGSAQEVAGAIRTFNQLKNVDVMIVGRGGGSLEDLWAFNEEVVARAIAASAIPVISAVGHEIDWTIADFAADFRAPTPSAAAELVIPEKRELVLRIDNALDRMKNALHNAVIQGEQALDEAIAHLAFSGKHVHSMKEEAFRTLIGKLEALSPLAVLGRGYSITEHDANGNVVRDAAGLKKDDRIRTRLHKGEIVSKVTRIKEASHG